MMQFKVHIYWPIRLWGTLIDLVKCHDAKLKVKESEIHHYILLK